MSNPLDQLKQVKDAERRQLSSGDPPSLEQFWIQPHAARLILFRSDVSERSTSIEWERGMRSIGQQLGKIEAFPAHVGTLLSLPQAGQLVGGEGHMVLGWVDESSGNNGLYNVDGRPADCR